MDASEASVSRPSKRAKKNTSRIWDKFAKVDVDGKSKAVCNICGKSYAYAYDYGTSNLHRHMLLQHGQLHDDDGSELAKLPFDQNHFRDLLAKSIIKHNLSFSFVEYEEIRNVFSYLNPHVQFITRNTVKADILSIYRKEKEKLKHELEAIPGRVCPTSDMWSSLTLDGCLSLTAHYVDENWKLQSKILNFRFMPPPHNGALLAQTIIGLLQDWGIESKVFTLTLDNASTNNGLIDVVKCHLNLSSSLLCGGDFFHIRCGAHILNLIVQSGLKVIGSCVDKVRENVKYVKGTQARLKKFAECVSHLSLKSGKKLRQDVATRWNATYQMLESAIQYKVAFYQQQGVDTKFKNCATEDDWKKVEKICNFLKPFQEMTTLFSGSRYPTANLYFLGVYRIQSLINEELEDFTSILFDVAIEMNEKFKKYWDCYSLILSFAVILDPRYKIKFVEFIYRKVYPTNFREKVKYVRDKMNELYFEYSRLSAVHSTSRTSRPTDHRSKQTIDALAEFEIFMSQEDEDDGSFSQLDAYLAEKRMDGTMQLDVLEYWKVNCNKYPILSYMARDILSIPITTVASESCFSIGGQIISKYRSSITPDNAEALLCTRSWLWGSEGLEREIFGDEDLENDIESILVDFGNIEDSNNNVEQQLDDGDESSPIGLD